MAPFDPFSSVGEFPLWGLFQTLIPDFVLSFAFFTALVYAILGRRFDHQRPAVVMSAAVGMALAMGLVWWEHQNGLSVRNLGPLAVGFSVILLAMVLFAGIRQTGGSWAGGAIAFGASILVAFILGFPWPFDPAVFQSLAIVALVVGIVAWFLHHHGAITHIHPLPPAGRMEVDQVRHDMSDLYEDRRVGGRLRHRLDQVRHEAHDLPKHPDQASDLMQQLQRLLPAEGWLTERLARLRAKAHLIREGHVHRLDELQGFLANLPASARKKLAADLSARYQQVIGIDERIERLDLATAENERRIRVITGEAREALARYDYARLNELLDGAEKLQKHNEKLFRIIDRTENKLAKLVEVAAQEASQVSQQ